MPSRRPLIVASTSGLGYPLAIFLVGAAITFRPVPLFAESAPGVYECSLLPPSPCDASAFESPCIGCGTDTCICTLERCQDTRDGEPADAGDAEAGSTEPEPPSRAVSFCAPILSCADPKRSACEGRDGGERCGDRRACFPRRCAARVGDRYELEVVMACDDDPTGLPATPELPPRPSGSEAAASSGEDDSGCNVSAGALGARAIPSALGLLWVVARLRRRARGRSMLSSG